MATAKAEVAVKLCEMGCSLCCCFLSLNQIMVQFDLSRDGYGKPVPIENQLETVMYMDYISLYSYGFPY